MILQDAKKFHIGGWTCLNFIKKTFAGGYQTAEFVSFLPWKFPAVRCYIIFNSARSVAVHSHNIISSTIICEYFIVKNVSFDEIFLRESSSSVLTYTVSICEVDEKLLHQQTFCEQN